MRKKHRITAAGLLLLGLVSGLAVPALAQAPAAETSPQPANDAPPATEGAGDAPAAPVAARAAAPTPVPAPGPDLAALARLLGAERRVLREEAGEFGVIVSAAEGDTATGTLLLLPADGQFPGASPGIARLREEMPVAGWTTWLVELEAPPRVQSLVAALAEPEPQAADGATTTPAPAASEAAAPAGAPAADGAKSAASASEAAAPQAPAEKPATAPAEGAQAADAQVQAPAIALDARLGKAHAEWIGRNRARVAAALTEAAKTGPVVLVAEGSASPVLVAALEKAEGLAALVLLAPVRLDEAPFAWPAKLPLPVLEVLEPGASPEDRAGSRERAHAAGVGNYRLMLLAMDGPSVGARESLLTRRVRGWLSNLARRDGG